MNFYHCPVLLDWSSFQFEYKLSPMVLYSKHWTENLICENVLCELYTRTLIHHIFLYEVNMTLKTRLLFFVYLQVKMSRCASGGIKQGQFSYSWESLTSDDYRLYLLNWNIKFSFWFLDSHNVYSPEFLAPGPTCISETCASLHFAFSIVAFQDSQS